MSVEQKSVVQEIVSGPHARVVGPYHAWLQSPELARRARNLSEFIRFKSSLPPRLSELGILIAGRFWKADFEYYAHAILAKKAGLADNIISDIAAKKRPTFENRDEQVVYDLCMELLETRRVSDQHFDVAVKMLGHTAVVELVATVGYYSMVSLTLNAFEVPLPPGELSPFPDA
jgi:4-carboxymuconolactone decarboxylase